MYQLLLRIFPAKDYTSPPFRPKRDVKATIFFNRTTVYKRRKLNSRTVGFPHRYLLYQNHLILSSFVLDRLNYIVYNALLLNTQLKNDEFKNISVRHMNLCTLDGVLLFGGHPVWGCPLFFTPYNKNSEVE